MKPIVLVLGLCAYGLIYSFWLSGYVLSKDIGTTAMRAVSDPIREGAEGFLKVQYSAVFRMAALLSVLIYLSYYLRPSAGLEDSAQGVSLLSNSYLGTLCVASFVTGASCSAAAGYLAMCRLLISILVVSMTSALTLIDTVFHFLRPGVAARTNIRVSSAARRSYSEALVICFRGGAFSAVLDLTLCVVGVTLLFVVLWSLHSTDIGVALGLVGENANERLHVTDIPILMVGYGFGASFVALFMQLGGGIYTKAADVGADLVGKVESSIPEDDPRNPAVIADLVGDMVGDCVGSSADVFESVGAEIIGAMILGGTLAKQSNLSNEESMPFVFFPLVVHAMDVLVSSVGILFVSTRSVSESASPMDTLTYGYQVTFGLALVGFAAACRWMFYLESFPSAWVHFFGCGVIGMVTAFIFMKSTQYFTDYDFNPVQSIARASTTGHGTNIIVGFSVGMKSTVVPVLTVSAAVILTYHLGMSTGLGVDEAKGLDGHAAGLFGTAVAVSVPTHK